MSQLWSYDFEPYLNEMDFVFNYFEMPRISECRKVGSWAIKIDKIELDASHGWWQRNTGFKLTTWTFVGKVVNSITVLDCTMDDVVRWILDNGRSNKF